MKIEELQAGQVYHTKVWSVTYDVPPSTSLSLYASSVKKRLVDSLMYIWSKGKISLKYELIAYVSDPVVYLLRTEKIAKQVKGMKPDNFKKVSDLSLYVHYKFKTVTFESLLKGDKPVKPSVTSYKL